MNARCERVRNLLAEGLTRLFTSREHEEVKRHLDNCQGCRAFQESLAEDDRQLAIFARSTTANFERMEERIMRTIQEENGARAVQQVRVGVLHFPMGLFLRLAGAAIVALPGQT